MSKFFRVIKEGFLGVKRHGAMSFSSASAVTMTMLIIGAFMILNANIGNIVNNVEGNVQIAVKIEASADQDEIILLQNRIERLSGVQKVEFSDKDQELELVIQSYEDEQQQRLFQMYAGENNPLRDAFLVTVINSEDIERVAHDIEAMEGIESVNYGGAATVSMIQSMEQLRRTGYIVVAALTALAILLISNTINTTINARKDEIFIMRTVGASNGFIRGPFIVEGIIIGILGAIIPVIILCGGYYWLYDYMDGVLFTNLFTLVEPLPFIEYLAGIIAGGGILVGALGSSLSVNRKLWWKR